MVKLEIGIVTAMILIPQKDKTLDKSEIFSLLFFIGAQKGAKHYKRWIIEENLAVSKPMNKNTTIR